MPVPKPQGGETQKDFIKRCYLQIKDEYPPAQSLGICYSQFKVILNKGIK